ncbi:anaerobic ribonucleoside-triphosphate reductase activating protein [Candidatus Bathyarchaeota archaeon]|nr:anaerobic ribonucleoside-triphosphate reductase activating protein [Candidatus Bathyarchaeota archaeon]
MKIRLGGIVDVSTVDWVGRPTTMLFLAGCSFACPWCQNANLISPESGELVSVSKVEERISRNLGLIDGIGFSGGEPTLQGKPLAEISSWAKHKGLGVLLNTNGDNPRVIQDLLDMNLVDRVASDVKAPLEPDEYSKVIGKSPLYCDGVIRKIRKTVSLCNKKNIPIEIRTTIIPNLVDRPDQIRDISQDLKNCERYILQQFVPNENVIDPRFRDLSPPNREHLLSLARIALGEGVKNVFIRSSSQGLEKVG